MQADRWRMPNLGGGAFLHGAVHRVCSAILRGALLATSSARRMAAEATYPQGCHGESALWTFRSPREQQASRQDTTFVIQAYVALRDVRAFGAERWLWTCLAVALRSIRWATFAPRSQEHEARPVRLFTRTSHDHICMEGSSAMSDASRPACVRHCAVQRMAKQETSSVAREARAQPHGHCVSLGHVAPGHGACLSRITGWRWEGRLAL